MANAKEASQEEIDQIFGPLDDKTGPSNEEMDAIFGKLPEADDDTGAMKTVTFAREFYRG